MNVRFHKKRGMLVLGAWLILYGVVTLLPEVKNSPANWNFLTVALAVGAVVAGILILIDW
jgi:hypothetical protein